MTDQTNSNTDTASALAELAAAAGLAPSAVADMLRAMQANLDRRMTEPANQQHTDRARFGRPGPKSVQQELARRRVAPGTRLADLPDDVCNLDLPALLPGDAAPAADDHPFGFRPVFYFPDGRPVPTEPAEDYFAAVAALERDPGRRIATTALHHRGAYVRISTVFLAQDAGDRRPPRLWETLIFLGRGRRGGAGIEAAGWTYASAAAARHGHTAVVAALRAAWATTPGRRRPPTAPGPWRAGYPARWR